MRDTAIRLALGLLIVIGYFFLIRPIRAEINQLMLSPIVEYGVTANSNIYAADESRSVSNVLFWGEKDSLNHLSVPVPFGLTFLVGMMGLVLVGTDLKFFGYLVVIQLVGGIIGVLSFYLGAVVHLKFLIITDLTIRYLTPLCSMGLAPLAFILKRQEFHERQAE